ncbi:MAG TPA: DUF1501 domain-containing protein [Planctomycetaceae bacterium]|nr:DUF1501 domain-containing protein [Planctomycetaceae bacterium]
MPLLPPAAHSRRQLLNSLGAGFGSLALAGVLDQAGLLAASHATEPPRSGNPLAPRQAHFPGKAKAVIQLCQNGGPSQMDLFDPKPELSKRDGQPHPEQVEVFQLGNRNVLMGTPFQFAKYGQTGMDFSEIVPHLAGVADDLCLIRSMFTENNNHPFALNMLQTGKTFNGRPAMGSWIGYALGTENQDLPCYIVLRDPGGYNTSGKMVWSCGWLPAVYQGTEFSSSGSPVLHLNPSRQVTPESQQRSRRFLQRLNQGHLDCHPGETELEARIQNFELAARMQLSASQVLDLSQETAATRQRYGLDNPATAGYGTRCLMARRLVESGVRFVQVFPPLDPSFQPWDNHSNLKNDLSKICGYVDQPSAALISDLKERGLLENVIVMWTGEFGRLPITEGANGRDHNRHAFSTLMAGGGFKAGHIHGATDEFGYKSVENRVSVPDLHATILHQLGIDHTKLTFVHSGRPERLTDPEVTGARVVSELLS